MAELGARAFAAAEAMIGVRFRPQGRDPQYGLDCVGLVWAAYAEAGVRLDAPHDYPLRGWSGGRVIAGLNSAGLRRIARPDHAADAGAGLIIGDVLLIRLGAGQFHIGISGEGCVIHAHAGLRLVVDSPWDAQWADADVWRAAVM